MRNLQNTNTKRFMSLMLVVVMLFSFFTVAFTPSYSFAKEAGVRPGSSGVNNKSGSESVKNLTDYVDNEVSEVRLKKKTGDTVKGKDVVKNGVPIKHEFEELDAKDQEKLSDMMVEAAYAKQRADEKAGDGVTNPVTNNTIQIWINEMKTTNGFAAKLLNQAMSGFGADVTGASDKLTLIKPYFNLFFGFIIIAIFVVMILGVLLDILYLVGPQFQMFFDTHRTVGNGGGTAEGSNKVFAFISNSVSVEAINAKEKSTAGDTSYLLKYLFKRSIVILIATSIVVLVITNTFTSVITGIVTKIFGT